MRSESTMRCGLGEQKVTILKIGKKIAYKPKVLPNTNVMISYMTKTPNPLTET